MFRFFRINILWVAFLPYLFMFVGASSNQLVLIANHDRFPVMINPIKLIDFGGDPEKPMMDDIHCQMTADTHLNMLADIFDFHSEIESIGDLSIDFGTWLNGFCVYVWAAIVCLKLRSADADNRNEMSH